MLGVHYNTVSTFSTNILQKDLSMQWTMPSAQASQMLYRTKKKLGSQTLRTQNRIPLAVHKNYRHTAHSRTTSGPPVKMRSIPAERHHPCPVRFIYENNEIKPNKISYVIDTQEFRFHYMTAKSGFTVPGTWYHTSGSGQPFRTYIERDTKVSGDKTGQVRVRIYSKTWFLAESNRKFLWKNSQTIPEKHTCQFQRGTGGTDLSVNCRSKRTSGSI